ncbi:undecaprenyl-phosphate glucose phosphotransferase [Eubacteriales bacterium OttesenSCG-928-A19]|nr:undecaprenyl-phosphate glucose phosphotransferase [Eubacteriales bacterium OttesenSCG-928-A19]
MIKRNQHLLNIASRLADLLLIVLAYLLSAYFRFDMMIGAMTMEMVWSRGAILAAVCYGVLLVFLYQYFGVYKPVRTQKFSRAAATIIATNVLGILILTGFLYITRVIDFSRIAIGIFAVLSTLFILGKHAATRLILREMRQRGYNQRHVVIVGNGSLATQYVESIRQNPRYGYRIDGYVSRTRRDHLGALLGTYEDLESILQNPGIDEVVIALEPHETHFLHDIVAVCDKQGTRSSIIPFFNNYTPDNLTIDNIGGCKLINVRTNPLDNVALAVIKRAFDIVGSFLLLLLTSPVMLIAAIGTKLSSPGPVIFKQERVGRNKRPFRMYKFRSMRVNPDETSGWTTGEDPRKTRFGSFLRKFSIDELPQFFNVLKGDMSLVGPRPELPHFVEQFRETIPLYMVKHQVRPGITGWAQVNGYRGDTSIEERIKCDIWYIENWSFALDIAILLRTVFGGMMNAEKLTK